MAPNIVLEFIKQIKVYNYCIKRENERVNLCSKLIQFMYQARDPQHWWGTLFRSVYPGDGESLRTYDYKRFSVGTNDTFLSK